MAFPAIFFSLLLLLLTTASSSPTLPSAASSNISVNSNSILVALLDSSHYTDVSELIEKALLLQTLESQIATHNLTIFAPKNDALERDLHPEFRRFLLEPRNLPSLQSLLLFHVIPQRLHYNSILRRRSNHRSLSGESNVIDPISVSRPDDVIRPDGMIHGIDRVWIPRSVQSTFNKRRNLASVSAVLPTGAPEVDPKTNRLKKPASPSPAGSPPALPIFAALAPGPSIAPAPAPGPGSGTHHFDGESQVKDFIHTLILYGGYNEFADILVNLTSLATEMGRLVSEGYVLTVLAPNDEAMAKLSADQLSESGTVEQIVYYHLIPEYQTEESMYNAVRRFGKLKYDTLRLPHKVVAREADGSVKFGEGESSAYLFDPDIYTDGRISVQGIDSVLFPEEETMATEPVATVEKKVSSTRRGKLLEVACHMMGVFGQQLKFTPCQLKD